MIKSKYSKAIIAGMCLSVISSSAVFGNSFQIEPREFPGIQIGSESELFQKHREIDNFIFLRYAEEIKLQGFTVTHTGPVGEEIEIGITPYSEENAQFLYNIVGTESIKIVEGQQAITLPLPIAYDTPISNSDISIRPISAPVIQISVDGELVEMDVLPIIENNRTLIPIRSVMEKMGATVNWNQEESAVEVLMDDISIVLHIGDDTAKVTRNLNATPSVETFKLDVPAKAVEGRTFIPGRFVAETLGAEVNWDDANYTVIIKTNDNQNIISVERPVDFEIIEAHTIEENKVLLNWYQENLETKGIHSLKQGQWQYVLVSAGEKPTGGYDLRVESITEVTPGTAYIHANLIAPDKDAFVTEAITYPNRLIRFEKGAIEQIQWDLTDFQPADLEIIEGMIGESLEEMGKAIAIEEIKEMKLYNLQQEELKTFTQGEISELMNHLNTGATYNGAYILMLAGNSIQITLKDGGHISLTSYGNKEHVIVSGEVNGQFISYNIISPELGSILLDSIN